MVGFGRVVSGLVAEFGGLFAGLVDEGVVVGGGGGAVVVGVGGVFEVGEFLLVGLCQAPLLLGEGQEVLRLPPRRVGPLLDLGDLVVVLFEAVAASPDHGEALVESAAPPLQPLVFEVAARVETGRLGADGPGGPESGVQRVPGAGAFGHAGVGMPYPRDRRRQIGVALDQLQAGVAQQFGELSGVVEVVAQQGPAVVGGGRLRCGQDLAYRVSETVPVVGGIGRGGQVL